MMNLKGCLILVICITSTIVSAKTSISIYESLSSSSINDEEKLELINNISSENETQELLKYYSDFNFDPYISGPLLKKLSSLGYLNKLEKLAIEYMKNAVKKAKENPYDIDSLRVQRIINIVNTFYTFNPEKKDLVKSKFTLPENMVVDHIKREMAEGSEDWANGEVQKLIEQSKQNPTNLFKNYIYFLFLDYLENCHKSVLGTCLFYTQDIRRDGNYFLPNRTKNILVKRFVDSPDTLSETNGVLLNTLINPSYMARLTKSDINLLVKVLENNLFFKVNDTEWKVPLLFILRYTLHSQECTDEYSTVAFWKKHKKEYGLIKVAIKSIKTSRNIYDINYAAKQIEFQGGAGFLRSELKCKNLRKFLWQRTEDEKDMPKYLQNALRSIFMQDKESVRYYNEKLSWLSKTTGEEILYK